MKYIYSIHTFRHCFILLCLALVLNIQSFSQQNNYIDSLITLSEKCTIDTQKVDLLNEISLVYQSENAEKTIEYAKEAWAISKRIDFERGLGESSLNLGKGYEMISEYKKAQDHFENAIKSFEKLGNIWGIGEAEKHIGFLYEYQGQYDKALNHYLTALNKMEEANDTQGIASCLNCLGGIYYFQNDFDNALSYFLRTLEKTKEIGNKFATATTQNNIGLSYIKMSENDSIDDINKESYQEKALSYLQQALDINKEIGHNYNIAQNLTNIGNVHNDRGESKEALDALNEALKIQEELGNQKEISRTLANIGLTYKKEARYSESLAFLFKSLKISREIGNKEGIKYAYDMISEVYFNKGDYQNAYEFVRNYTKIKDTILNEENSKVISQLQEQFNAKEREQEIQLLNKDKELDNEKIKRQRALIIIFVAVSIVILVFLIMLFRLFTQKRKANILLAKQNEEILMQKEEIESQRDEIAAQRDEIEAKRDLVTKQKEHIEEIHEELKSSIHYAERIQKAVLPSATFLTDNLPDHFVLFRPHSVVSGDFYWSTRIKNYAIFTAADCTGHGVPGAFMSMLGISFLNEIVGKKEILNAGQILDNLRASVVQALGQKGISGEQKDGMDISLCVLDLDTSSIQWAGANNPLYIITDYDLMPVDDDTMTSEDGTYKLFELRPDKMPIAIYEKMDNFTVNEMKLEPGSMLYMFSDGFADQFGGPKGKKFKYKPFKQILLETAARPMAEQKEELNRRFQEWLDFSDEEGKKYEQIDDVVVFGVKV